MASVYDYGSSKSVKIFIGCIPGDVLEDQLRWELAKFGNLKSIFYMPDLGHESMGWAFATYNDHYSGIAAVNAINDELFFAGSNVPCKAQFVTPRSAQEYTKLKGNTRNWPVTATTEWQQFTNTDGMLYYYNKRTGETQWQRPYELPNFSLLPKRVTNSASYGPPGSNLFVFHLPPEWSDSDLLLHFQSFGTIVSARVQLDTVGRNRGYGFVSYDNPTSALTAIKNMNGYSVCGKYLKVQLKRGEEQMALTNELEAPFSSDIRPVSSDDTSYSLCDTDQ
ncbi:RNA recognition motif domain containing protein [Babesia bovis T2Bo]|uniref:RNA binding motif containing protein n=1 Tax=Babesia bovis TaxID=5865 RepID=A7AR42_BABBO|nr:RNA recognition motif domain containing protein [Babesia bovis T2Bo]EDO07011.1 RNA recognition motif domain containing protein [Babesia bovis T2Bo]BAN65752.1 RNA binding motif containing protein [Babesia bovis]|eukprot:XP_001610579.1 RNA binding motif containing protein [Babesia bovis T2Bo]